MVLKITSNNVPVPLRDPNNALSTVPGGFLSIKKYSEKDEQTALKYFTVHSFLNV